jgi:HK97 family phage major capsid protein
MALITLLKRTKLTAAQNEMAELEKAGEALEARSADLENAIRELGEKADATEEERSAVENAVTEFENDKAAHETRKTELEKKISDLTAELEAEEARQTEAAKAKEPAKEPEKREDDKAMNTREFFGMSHEERDAFLAREDVKGFLQRVRDLGSSNQRGLTGGSLLIPEIMLGVLRENIQNWSKLYRHVNVRTVPGNARQVVTGAIPEAVWTEMCATLNELALTYTQVEVDGYKVGGYIPVCNALLQDSDVNLAAEIMTVLGASLGIALDKAILFGTGATGKMPTGITTAITSISANNIAISAANSEGIKLFKNLISGFANADGKYSRGDRFWVMNEKTYAAIQAEALSINAAGAIVSGVNGVMPVLGGAIEVLDFVPDNIIIAGYPDLYLLAERAGSTLASSEHVRFIEDQTVFKATARYDGKPVIPAAFVVFGVNGATIATQLATVTFAQDTANAGE